MKRIWKMLAAMLLVIGGVFVTATPAYAATTSDCFPGGCSGYYQSTGNHGGRAGWDAAPFYESKINWVNGTHTINIRGNVQDVAADGNGPILRIKICQPNWSNYCDYYRWHWTGGNGTSHSYNSDLTTVDNAYQIDDSTEVWLQMCNGVNSSNYELNCETTSTGIVYWHGPFHH